MKKIVSLLFITLILGIGTIAFGATTTITFDDLGVGSGSLPANYAGLTWSSNWGYFQSSASYPSSSGTVLAHTADVFNQAVSINFGQDVTFLGSYVTTYDAYGRYATFQWSGYDNGVLKYSSDLFTEGYRGTVSLNWAGVDLVEFRPTNSTSSYYALDDIKYTSVPEPTGLILLGVGLIGLVPLARRRK